MKDRLVCGKCGKPKFGAWSTICSAEIGKINELYCQCSETFTMPTAPSSGLSAEQYAREKRRAIFDGLNDVFTADQWVVIERGMAYFGELYADKLREERDALKFRLYYYAEFKGTAHTTACSIWREDGQGHAEGFEGDRGPCNCGALENFQRERAERAEAELERLREKLRNQMTELVNLWLHDGRY